MSPISQSLAGASSVHGPNPFGISWQEGAATSAAEAAAQWSLSEGKQLLRCSSRLGD